MCAQRRLRSAGQPPSLVRVFAVRMKTAWVLSYPLSAQRRLCSDWADDQADLSLRWAYSHFVGFVMRRLNYFFFPLFLSRCGTGDMGGLFLFIYLFLYSSVLLPYSGEKQTDTFKVSFEFMNMKPILSYRLFCLLLLLFYVFNSCSLNRV